MLSKWKKEALDGLPSLFRKDSAKKRKEEQERETQMDELYTQIGKLTTQLEWLKKNLAAEVTARQCRQAGGYGWGGAARQYTGRTVRD